MIGDLPAHLFFESNGSKNSPINIDTNTGGRNSRASAQMADKSIAEKNATIEFAVLTEACGNIVSNLRDSNEQKRKLEKEFISDACGGNRKVGKARMQRYFHLQDKDKDKENIEGSVE